MTLSRTLLRRHSVLPGFDLSLGCALLYLGLIVLIPLSAAFLKTFTMTWPAFWEAVSSPRVVASYRLTFWASLIGASINAFFGLIAAVFALTGLILSIPLIVTYLETGLVPRFPTAILIVGLMVIAALNGMCGLILDTVVRGRREVKRLSYLAHSAPADFTRRR